MIKKTVITLALFTSLNASGDVEAIYTADFANNVDGGVKRGGAMLDNFGLAFSKETSSGEFAASILYNNATSFSEEYVGDSQVVSNIDNTSVVRLYEFWYRHDFNEQHHVQLGLMDLNAYFDAIDTAGLFINSSHGIGADYAQSGEAGPSIFPATSMAVNYQVNLNDSTSWQFAVFDAVPGDRDDPMKNTIKFSSDEGALLATQVDVQTESLRYAAGMWYYTEPTDYLDGTDTAKNHGFYGLVEKVASEQENSFAWWLRAGQAQSDINAIENYVGAGLTLNNFNPDNPNDLVGVAVASAVASDSFKRVEGGSSNETVIELTYSRQVTPWLRLQPDLQYVINPGISNDLDDALVFILRAEVDLTAF